MNLNYSRKVLVTYLVLLFHVDQCGRCVDGVVVNCMLLLLLMVVNE